MAVPADKPLADLSAAEQTHRAEIRRHPLVALGAGLLALFVLFHDTLAAMAAIWWRSDTFAHGMLIGPIVVYMLAGRRAEIGRITPRPDSAGVLALLALSLGWAVAAAAEVGVVQQLALAVMVPAMVWAVLGRRVLWAAAFPLAYLLFAVPMGESLVEPLQDFTAVFTVKALRLSGIPVFSEGRYITTPTGNFEVAEACSGIRYLIASVALGCLYAYLTYRAAWRRLAFIALAIVMPIVANGVRAYGIVMIALLSDMKLATGVDHIIYGWLFFGLVVMLMFWIGRFWADDAAAAGTAAAVPPDFAPAPTWRALGGMLAAALLATAAGPILVMRLDEAQRDATVTLPTPPAAGGAWSVTAAEEWRHTYRNAAGQVRADYLQHGDEGRVQFLAAAYPTRRGVAPLVSSGNLLYDAEQWVHAGEELRTVSVAGQAFEVRELRLISGERRRMIWSWYAIGPRHVVPMPAAKAWQAWESLTGGPRRDLVVALATASADRPDEARERLTAFVSAHWQTLREQYVAAP